MRSNRTPLRTCRHEARRRNAEAIKWYRKAADQGFQSNLGIRYETGHGVAQDYAEAVKWHRKATERGFARSQTDGFPYRDCAYH
jgi:uncharacterized protein